LSTQKQVLRYQALKNMENQFENLDSQNEENENANSSNGESEEVDVDALKEENVKLKKTNQGLYEESQKAKGFVRGSDGKWVKPAPKETKEESTETKSETMSLKDIRALQDVHDEDVDELIEYAKFKGVSVAEVKKNPVIQAHLRTKEEERKTAAATNTGAGGRATSKITGDTLLERAINENVVPETQEGMDALVKSMIERKISKKS